MKNLLAVALLVTFVAPASFAKGGGHKAHKKIFKKLDLTDEQKKSLETMRKEQGDSMKALRQKKKTLRESMDSALIGDASEAKLRGIHSELTTLQTQIKTKRFEKMLKIRNILSPEQRKTFFEMKKKMKKGKRRHH